MKNDRMVGTRIPKELVKELEHIEQTEHSDRSTILRKLLARAIDTWKLEHYARMYAQRKLTMARAARNAGVSLWEFQEFVRAARVPVQYDEKDLAHDLSVLD